MLSILVEYRGHRLLEAARQADAALTKKHLASDIVNFRHPYTGDTALVCCVYFYDDKTN